MHANDCLMPFTYELFVVCVLQKMLERFYINRQIDWILFCAH